MADINATLAQTTILLERMNQNLNSMVQSTQRYVRDQSESSESYRTHTRLLDDDSDQMELREDQLKKEGKLTDTEIKRRMELEAALRKQVKVVESLNKAIKSEKDQGELKRLLERRQSAVTVMNKRKESLASDKLGGGLAGIAKKFNLLGVAISFILNLFVGQYRQSKEFIEASAGFVEGTSLAEAQFRRAGQAFDFAMKQIDLQKLLVANRQVVHALGGTAKTLDRVKPAFEEFRRFGVDAKDAMQAALESLTMFRKLGIQSTTREMVAYAQDVAQMGKLFSMAEPEARAYFDEIANEADSIDLLKRARADERAAILESQRSFIILARAQGMTAENEKEAAKMLNKMVGAKPLDRLKQAARTQALAGAMGVSGGAEAAAAMRAGSRRTPEQIAMLGDFSKRMATAADSMRGAGLGSEIFAEALLEKLDPEGMFGRSSPFSMTLAKTMEINTKEISKNMSDLASSSDIGAAAVRGIHDTLVRGGEMMNSITGILAGVRGIFGWLTGSWLDKMFGSTTADQAQLQSKAGTGGDMAGEAAWEDSVQTQTNMATQAKKADDVAARSAEKTAEKQDAGNAIAKEHVQEAKTTREGIQTQTKQMNEGNDTLAKIRENSDKQISLMEKQLAVLLLTEKEKQEGTLRSKVREGNKFLESYGYL